MVQNVTTSIMLGNHRHKLQLDDIAFHIDYLCIQYDNLAVGHPDRFRLIRRIEHWNVEFQA